MKRIPLPTYVPISGARFESTERFLANSVVVSSKADKLRYSGVVMSRINVEEATYATVKDELHTFVIGESGCGKTRRVVRPTIRLAAKSGKSMVITDPKGELYKYESEALRAANYEVRVINFKNPSFGDRWNPFTLVEELYRSGNDDSRSYALEMVDNISSDCVASIHSDKDAYWETQAQDLFNGIVQLILRYYPAGSLSFQNIAAIAHNMSSEYHRKFTPPDAQTLKKFVSELPAEDPIASAITSALNLPKDTYGCLMGVFNSMIANYNKKESLSQLFAASDFDPADLGKRPMAVFFILPDDSDSMYPIATTFVHQLYTTLIRQADANPSGKLDNPVMFVLDEFANFTKLPDAASMLTASRSRGISYMLVCQSMEQLFEKYKDYGAEILMANCRVWIYMKCRNLPFLKRLQELCGIFITPYGSDSAARPLVDISDLQTMEMGTALILNDVCRPTYGFLPDISEYDFGKEYPRAQLTERTAVHPKVISLQELYARGSQTADESLRSVLSRPGTAPAGAAELPRATPSSLFEALFGSDNPIPSSSDKPSADTPAATSAPPISDDVASWFNDEDDSADAPASGSGSGSDAGLSILDRIAAEMKKLEESEKE